MKLLVVGSGGREHAIAKKLLESKTLKKVFVAWKYMEWLWMVWNW